MKRYTHLCRYVDCPAIIALRKRTQNGMSFYAHVRDDEDIKEVLQKADSDVCKDVSHYELAGRFNEIPM